MKRLSTLVYALSFWVLTAFMLQQISTLPPAAAILAAAVLLHLWVRTVRDLVISPLPSTLRFSVFMLAKTGVEDRPARSTVATVIKGVQDACRC